MQHQQVNLAMQNIKTQLGWSALTLCSPWYKLLYMAMPWLAEAKRIRQGMQGARQVGHLAHCQHAMHCCNICHKSMRFGQRHLQMYMLRHAVVDDGCIPNVKCNFIHL